jgi:Uncharacterized protein conserved in bacteria (DUF2188)
MAKASNSNTLLPFRSFAKSRQRWKSFKHLLELFSALNYGSFVPRSWIIPPIKPIYLVTYTKLITMKNRSYFIEKREDDGDFAVRKPNSDRASDILPTQKEAIERARQLDPNATIHVERVRHIDFGNPDKWRKP